MAPVSTQKECALVAFLIPLPGKGEELQQVLQGLARNILQEAGCLRANVTRAPGEEDALTLFTLWVGPLALARFQVSDSFRILMGASSVLSAPAQIRFLAGNTTDGSEVQAGPGNPAGPKVLEGFPL